MRYHEFIIISMLIYSTIISLMYRSLKFKTKKVPNLEELRDSKEKLELILNSTAEAIYEIDDKGNCTFCNRRCLEILGYYDHSDLLGKNMHTQIHHSYKDGSPMFIKDCKIIESLKTGIGAHSDDEVFWTSDGKFFDVEYRSYPKLKDREVIGAVVTFVDITEEKKTREEIIYLSCHDPLTGLYNRMFFETELKRLDTERNLPISVIVGDANNLKLTNDVFGHSVGDELLKKISEVFKGVCRSDDIIARIGGDEFVILLPNTEARAAEKIIKRIKDEISKEEIMAIKTSISMGTSTRENIGQDILNVLEDAENKMYYDKTINSKNNNIDQIRGIIDSLHENYPREKIHSKNVSRLSQAIGRAMNLSKEETRKLQDAGYLHDIGKLVLDDRIIGNGPVTEKEIREYKRHSVVGYRILNSFDKTLDLANVVLAHHEHWDGSGFPKGLKGNEIPLLARIIAVAEGYDSKTNEMNKIIMKKEDAIDYIKKESGIKFDPYIVDIFIKSIK
ncbi:diguanylate cyclase [Clostridiisalibacter paucivorans]|uniref:diguanylate cyclase n=1 Tax=Clostridiisalibacter paucivorans TaxID=408753 RepID=UPI000686B0B1|nr:diguanylate cyclase [Clostridiisalibacter paucivorans]